MAIEIFGFTPEQVYGEADVKETVDSRYGFSPRTAMQRLGQSARDHLWAHVWIDALFRQIHEQSPYLAVVEDVRYINEACQFHLHRQAHTIRIVCEDVPWSGDHPSEAEVDQIPAAWLLGEVRGSRQAGLEDLFEKVDALLAGVL